MKRRHFLIAGFTSIFTLGLGYAWGSRGRSLTPPTSTPTIGKSQYHWKMTTSWPDNAPGTGHTANRLARRIEALTAGRLRITVYAAGSLVGPLEVFDAVQRGTAQLGHTASFYWQGKAPSSVYFTTVPFGLSPLEHHTWLEQGGGQSLWNELYGDFGLQAFAAGNPGPSMGGWYKRPLSDGADAFNGVKIRMPGLAGKVVALAGAIPVTVAPGEIFESLRSGVLDAAEFLGPWHDEAFGLHKAAKHYYYPGFHEPNGSAECLINRAAFSRLPQSLRDAVQEACRAENIASLAESKYHNALALERLTRAGNVQLHKYSDALLLNLKKKTEQLLADMSQNAKIDKQIYNSYRRTQSILSKTRNTQLSYLQ